MKMECPDFKSGKCAHASCPHAGEHDETPDCAMGGNPCPRCVPAEVKLCAWCAHLDSIMPCGVCVRGKNMRVDFWTPRAAPTMPQEPRTSSPYGFCPVCGCEGVLRERRPDGDDICAAGHRYPSITAKVSP